MQKKQKKTHKVCVCAKSLIILNGFHEYYMYEYDIDPWGVIFPPPL